MLLLGLRGTPFLYAGEELGLEDAAIPPGRVTDPGGRDGCRAPIPWTTAADHGWPGSPPWLPWAPEPDRRNVEALRADPASILNLYRRLLALRRASPALHLGAQVVLPSPDGSLIVARDAPGDRKLVLVNFTASSLVVPASGMVTLASDGAAGGTPYGGVLAPQQALVLTAA